MYLENQKKKNINDSFEMGGYSSTNSVPSKLTRTRK